MASAAYPQTCPPYKTQQANFHRHPQARVADTHSKAIGYLFWVVGFTGAHRFFYGKSLTGVLWFFTFGLFGIGWLIDLFLIPSMDREASHHFRSGDTDYNLSWVLLVFLGVFGLHRFYQQRIFTGILYLFTGGLFGIGYIYDVLTMNSQIDDLHAKRRQQYAK